MAMTLLYSATKRGRGIIVTALGKVVIVNSNGVALRPHFHISKVQAFVRNVISYRVSPFHEAGVAILINRRLM